MKSSKKPKMGILTIVGIILAAVGGVCITVGQYYDRTKGAEGIKDKIEESQSDIKTHLNDIVKNLEESPEGKEELEGYSVFARMKIVDQKSDKREFILDGGEIEKNRISIYLDNKNNLCFRVIDKNSDVHTVKMLNENYNFLNKYKTFVFEVGVSDNYSFLRIKMNNAVEVRSKYDYKIEFDNELTIAGDVWLGVNIEGTEFGKFYLVETGIFSKTLSEERIGNLTDEINSEKVHKTFYFNGKAAIAQNKKESGNTNLTKNPKNAEHPTLHIEKE